jgi:transposase
MNTKLHAVTDANGRPISLFMTAGQVSDYTGAAAMLDGLPRARWLLGDRGYEADWFRDALQAKRHHTLHPWPEVPERARPLRQAPLQTAQPT